MLRHLLLSVAVAAAAATSVAAQPKPQPPACTASEYHQWDFWLGAWRVTDPAGHLQGTSRVVRSPQGCAIEEHWLNGSGVGGGDSFNVYDPTRQTWTQLWSGWGDVIRLEGTLDETGAMRLEGVVANRQGGEEHLFRGSWTARPDGSVVQEFLQQDPKTKAWSNWFTGVYRRPELAGRRRVR